MRKSLEQQPISIDYFTEFLAFKHVLKKITRFLGKKEFMRMIFRVLLLCNIAIFLCSPLLAQRNFFGYFSFSKADTLRGMLRPERTCYDVHFYELDLKVDLEEKFIEGFVDIHYKVVEDFQRLQIDLYNNMEIKKIKFGRKELDFERTFNAVFIDFPKQKAGQNGKFRVYYEGNPQKANNPPWDGGWSWAVDAYKRPWAAVSCEGDGASLWWPNKDHLSDEPDSVAINLTVKDPLIAVANGNLRKKVPAKKGHTRYEWFVTYPINNYNITANIGYYSHFSDTYTAGDGDVLALDYYVLDYNLEKAKKHFQQVPQTLSCFENYFGKYPFWEDGFALVETPYLGMEHQSAIAYGNRYQRGYLGRMIPDDMNWDYIIVHETGHEYFGNSISVGDLSEMWIHESFTTYMEALFVECAFSYEDAVRYLGSQRPFIRNNQPVMGPKDVNWENWDHSDHYYKGAWMLHTLRHTIEDDELWFDLLFDFYKKHEYSITTSENFIEYVNERTGKDYTAFFEQYLWFPKIPRLVYALKPMGDDLEVSYRWNFAIPEFDMSVLVGKEGAYEKIQPNASEYQSIILHDVKPDEFKVATELFLIDTLKKRR